MIIGNPDSFAIEYSIKYSVASPSQVALGCFNIHLRGRRYGVYSDEATLLGCSVCAVKERLKRRGRHTSVFLPQVEAKVLAGSYLMEVFSPEGEGRQYFGMSCEEFVEYIYSHHIVWAPDGDEAFDDSSSVLQIDVEDKVRIIGFTSDAVGTFDAATLNDVWLNADEFYGILQEWLDDFALELGRSQGRERFSSRK